MGVGGIGINAVQGAAPAGATHLIAVDPVECKRSKALEFGATEVFDNIEDADAFARSVTNGQGADSAIVTIGVVKGEHIAAAVAAIRKAGTVVLTGLGLVTGGKRPPHLDRGFYIEPTLFAGVDNASAIAQEEIFGPVLSVIPAESEADAVRIANDTIYGLNASVFTPDVDRARAVAARLRSGTVGHNAFRTDLGIAFGGFKQSGTGREGGREGLSAYLETKTIILEGRPSGYVA